jgi:Amt family ammonium transporter
MKSHIKSAPLWVAVALIIGMGAGGIGFYGVTLLKRKLNYDDSLDVFGVHGMCGIWGALATGLLADPAITEGASGLFYGNPKQLWVQFVSIVATALFTAIGTFFVFMVTKILTHGIRVSPEDEIEGLDSAVHGERAFEIS